MRTDEPSGPQPFSIKAARKARGLTQAELGELVGVGQARIANIESDASCISVDQYLRVLHVLGVELSYAAKQDWQPPARQEHSFVYVFRHKSIQALKIGKADDVGARAETLGHDDIERVATIQAKSAADAIRVGRVLHRTFHDWRIPSPIAKGMGLPNGGASEWFKAECFGRLMSFIDQNGDLLN